MSDDIPNTDIGFWLEYYVEVNERHFAVNYNTNLSARFIFPIFSIRFADSLTMYFLVQMTKETLTRFYTNTSEPCGTEHTTQQQFIARLKKIHILMGF